MPIGLLALAALVVPLVVAYAATPLAIRVAGRFEFYDHPIGYKGHHRPTPYLGGAAVVGAFVIAALIVAGHPHRTIPVVGGMLVLWGVGTLDDRVGLSPWLRLAVECLLAGVLWALGLGWDLGLGPAVDLIVTALWIAAVVNAFNLFDNMDGAASTLAAAAAGGTALLGIVIGDRWLTASAAALCGACLGFLPHNLSRPAKIFLGDGGSMPVGFGVAALVMIGTADAAGEWQALAMGLLFVGIPAVDTCLVMISRRRRGVPILVGGRDHLTHRTHDRLRTARAVAVALGSAQALLAVLALMTVHNGSGALVAVVCVYLVAAGAAIAMLDANYVAAEFETGATSSAADDLERRGGRALAGGAAWVLVPMGLAVGLSSFAEGLYASTRWAPVGLALIALLVALLLARPARPSAPALAAMGGLAGLAAWALLSSLWGESPYGAIVDGNRLIVLTAFLAVCVLLIWTRRAAVWALGAATAGALAVTGWQLWQLLVTDGHRVIAAGRLEGPLGYINGQACVALLAIFPCLALAEHRGRPWLAGVGAGCVTALAGVALLLSQSRGVALGLLAGTVVVFAAAPGRVRRAAAVVVSGLGTLAASHWLLEVYRQSVGSVFPPRATLREAVLALLVASICAGLAWGAIVAAEARLGSVQLARVARTWRWALTAAGVLLALAAAVRGPAVANAVSDQFHRLSHGQAVEAQSVGGTSRLGTDASNRYEYWKIAVRAFRDDPVAGVGAGGYDVPYFRQRTSGENVTQPHSLVFQTLAELGIVGALLLALFVGGVAWGAVRCARAARTSSAEAGLVVAAAGTFTAWLLHTSVDWIHLLPGVTGVALLAAAVLLRPVAAGAAPGVPTRHVRTGRFRARLVVAPLLGLAIAAGAVSLARQVLAEHYRDNAEATVVSDPGGALRQADLALGVDGSDLRSLDVKSAALSRLGDERQAGVVLRQALAKEPNNFVTYLLLGDHEVRAGDLAAARAAYRRAQALNPRDKTIRALVRHPGGPPGS